MLTFRVSFLNLVTNKCKGLFMKTSNVLYYFKNKVNIGKALGISKSAISQWGENVPVRRAYELERITNGALSYNYTAPQKDKKAA